MQIINPFQYYFFNLILPSIVILTIIIVVIVAYKMGALGRSKGKTVVLVVCPFCGSKNEQGIVKCQNCGGEI